MIPEEFSRKMIELNGRQGAAWIDRLPDMLSDLARRWDVQLEPPFLPLSYNYVAPARRADGIPLVLKVGFPDRELLGEMDALQLYDGRGCVRLLEYDREHGAMLLERVLPGEMLFHLPDDDAATRIAAETMQRLWKHLPADHGFITALDWAAGLGRLRVRFSGGAGPFPKRLVERAERLFTELLDPAARPLLLHGDLHHYNILSSRRASWLAIDPKGIAGEPGFEVGPWLINPMPAVLSRPDLDSLCRRRVAILAEALGLERDCIAGHGYARAVLSAWWSFEENSNHWADTLVVAEALEPLTG